MRHRITYGIVILPLIIALIRARNHPYFATPDTYVVLNALPFSHRIVIAATIILSVATMLCAVTMMRSMRTPREAYFVLLLSPPVLAAAIMNPFALLLALLAVIAAIYKDSYKASIIVAAACYAHPSAAVLALTHIGYSLYTKNYHRAAATAALSGLLAAISPMGLTLATRFAELQAPGAISVIAVLLGVLGAILLWDENTSIPLLITFIPLLSGLVFLELALVSAIVSAILSGHALRILRRRQWQLSAVKTATTYFIILGLLFAATASTSQAINAQPRAEILETVQVTAEFVDSEVSTLSGQTSVLRWYGIQAVDAKEILDVQTSDQLREQATTYILIEDGYRASKLRFLLENSNSYVRIRDADHDLWRNVR